MKIKLIEAFDLMSRCVNSCTSENQLSLIMEWVAEAMTPSKFPDNDALDIVDARAILFRAIGDRHKNITKEKDKLEVELKTQTINE